MVYKSYLLRFLLKFDINIYRIGFGILGNGHIYYEIIKIERVSTLGEMCTSSHLS